MHKTEIVAYRKLSNGQFAVLVRCCSDETHQQWHTVSAEVAADPAMLALSLAHHHMRVAGLHSAMQQAEENLKALAGDQKEHDI